MDGVAILRVDVPIYFANAQSIKTRLKNFEELMQVGAPATYLQPSCLVGRGVTLYSAWLLLGRDGTGERGAPIPPGYLTCAIPWNACRSGAQPLLLSCAVLVSHCGAFKVSASKAAS